MTHHEQCPSSEEFCEALTAAWKRIGHEACGLLAYMLCPSENEEAADDMKQDEPPNVSDERTTIEGGQP